ncbi:MAG: glycoside hydrolase family 32 protein, partial [Akkermansiaceae bacterium]|nr:glycoside hydrolase family 32 protein [Akkermansiaceae bacterium]
GGSPALPEVLGPAYEFPPDGLTMLASVPRRAAAEGAAISFETSTDLRNWSVAADVTLLSNQRLPGSSPGIDLLTFEVPLSGPPQFFRVIFGP